MNERIWSCKIGGQTGELPNGADFPMRIAIRNAYREITGCEDAFLFSGWAAELTEPERAVVENREPRPEAVTSNDVLARDEAWRSFANREPAPTHKDCFHAGWVSGKGYARTAHETAAPRTDHAENLAKAVEHYDSSSDHDEAGDNWRAVGRALHEYRKHSAQKTSPEPGNAT